MTTKQLRKKLHGCQYYNDIQIIINHQCVYGVYPMTITTKKKDLILNLVESDVLFDAQDLIYYVRANKDDNKIAFNYNKKTYYKYNVVINNDTNQLLIILGGK